VQSARQPRQHAQRVGGGLRDRLLARDRPQLGERIGNARHLRRFVALARDPFRGDVGRVGLEHVGVRRQLARQPPIAQRAVEVIAPPKPSAKPSSRYCVAC